MMSGGDDPDFDEGQDEYTSKGSVFHAILDSEKEAIRPEEIAPNPDDEESDDSGKKKRESAGVKPKGSTASLASRQALRSGEESASESGDGRKSLQDAERSDSGFVNKVGKVSKAGAIANLFGGNKKKKKRGRFMPTVMLTSTLLMGAFAGIFGAQTNTLFQLVENMKLMRDQITVSRRMRTRVFYRYQADADNGRVHKSCKTKAFNGDQFRLKPDGKMAKKLARVGIEVDADGKTMHWKSATGQEYTIITDKNLKSQTKHMSAEQKTKFLADFEAENGSKLVGYEDLYTKNPEFRNSAYTALRTIKGAFHEMYSNVGKSVMKRLGNIKRFVFKDFDPNADDAEADFQARTSLDGDVEVKTKASELKEIPDGEEGDTAHLTGDGGDEEKPLKIESEDTKSTKVKPGDGEKIVKDIAEPARKATSFLSGAVNGYCIYSEIITNVNLVVHGIQVANSVQRAIDLVNGVDMARTEEYASNSPIHFIGQAVEKQAEVNGEFAGIVNRALFNGAAGLSAAIVNKEQKTIKGRFSDSPSIASYISGEPVNPFSEKVKTFMIQSGISDFMEALKYSADRAIFCAHARRAAAYVGAISDGVQGIACIVSIFVAGGAACGTLVKSFAVAAGIAAGITVLVSILVPYVENAILMGKQSAFTGILGGEQTAMGFDTAEEGISKTEGGAPQTKDTLQASMLAQNRIIAEEAEYIRRNTSPFDASTQFTFAGSLLKSMSVIKTDSDSLLGLMKGIGSVVSSSANSLLPTASAKDVSEKVDKIVAYSEAGCPNLTSVGGVGNQFCSPYMGTDLTTMEDDPADVVNTVDSYGDFEDSDSGDQPTIKKDSDLAKYIIYCGQRTSPYGVADVNIANEIGDFASTGNGLGDATIGAIPVAGDVIDIVQNSDKLDNFAYITGEACIQNNQNTSKEVPDWSTAKNYQRFIEDQYLAESEGITKEGSNPVDKIIAEYYEEHPLDNSYEGIIARFSGRSKDTVIAVLDLMEYTEWLAQYDPSDLGPTPSPQEEDFDYQFEGEQTLIASVDVIFRASFSEERRQRNFAA